MANPPPTLLRLTNQLDALSLDSAASAAFSPQMAAQFGRNFTIMPSSVPNSARSVEHPELTAVSSLSRQVSSAHLFPDVSPQTLEDRKRQFISIQEERLCRSLRTPLLLAPTASIATPKIDDDFHDKLPCILTQSDTLIRLSWYASCTPEQEEYLAGFFTTHHDSKIAIDLSYLSLCNASQTFIQLLAPYASSLKLSQIDKEVDLVKLLPLSEAGKITVLELNGCSFPEKSFPETFYAYFPHLETLTITNHPTLTLDTLTQIIQQTTKLHTISLSGCPALEENTLLQILKIAPHVRNIELSANMSATFFLSPISWPFPHALTTLTLNHIQQDTINVDHITSAFPQLLSLTIEGNHALEIDGSRTHSLRSLTIKNNQKIQDTTLHNLARIFPNLESLEFSQNTLLSRLALSYLLRNFRKLQSLSFDNTTLAKENFRIQEGYFQNSELSTLSLTGLELEEQALSRIALLPDLKKLNLQSCSNIDLTALLEIIRRHDLKELNILNCPFTELEVAQICTHAGKNCKVVHSFPPLSIPEEESKLIHSLYYLESLLGNLSFQQKDRTLEISIHANCLEHLADAPYRSPPELLQLSYRLKVKVEWNGLVEGTQAFYFLQDIAPRLEELTVTTPILQTEATPTFNYRFENLTKLTFENCPLTDQQLDDMILPQLQFLTIRGKPTHLSTILKFYRKHPGIEIHCTSIVGQVPTDIPISEQLFLLSFLHKHNALRNIQTLLQNLTLHTFPEFFIGAHKLDIPPLKVQTDAFFKEKVGRYVSLSWKEKDTVVVDFHGTLDLITRFNVCDIIKQIAKDRSLKIDFCIRETANSGNEQYFTPLLREIKSQLTAFRYILETFSSILPYIESYAEQIDDVSLLEFQNCSLRTLSPIIFPEQRVKLSTLTFTNCTDFRPFFNTILNKAHNLSTLQFINCDLTDDELQILLPNLILLKNVKIVNCKNISMRTALSVSEKPQLETLSLKGCSPKNMQPLAFQALISLDLSETEIGTEHLNKISCSTLKELYLSDTRCSDDSLVVISRNFPQLLTLDIDKCQITIPPLLSLIKNYSGKTEIIFSTDKFTRFEREFFKYLKNPGSLTIDFSTKPSPEFIELAFLFYSKNSGLELENIDKATDSLLTVVKNGITGKKFPHLSISSSINRPYLALGTIIDQCELTSLTLKGPFATLFLTHFEEKFKKIHSLSLECTNITAFQVQNIRRSFVDLKEVTLTE